MGFYSESADWKPTSHCGLNRLGVLCLVTGFHIIVTCTEQGVQGTLLFGPFFLGLYCSPDTRQGCIDLLTCHQRQMVFPTHTMCVPSKQC